jgi:spermidine synthase
MGLLGDVTGRIGNFIHKSVTDAASIEVTEQDGVRSLHLGSVTVQSSMRVAAPYELVLTYTRGMMAFLLFQPAPREVLAIGLGGGSLPKFMRRYVIGARTTVVEINPQVVAVARSHFHLQADDEYLHVVTGDGAEYVRNPPTANDILLVDSYDSHGIARNLSSRDFYDACFAALSPHGILVVNLWGSDKNFDTYLQRIEQAFSGRILIMPTGRPGNIIVFAFRRDPGDLRWKTLRERGKALQEQYRIEFLEFVERLRDNNLNTVNRLLL